MATILTDKEFVTIKVPKTIGQRGIRKIKEYAKYLEKNKKDTGRVSQKEIRQKADEITSSAWEKLKKKRGFKW